MDGQLFCSVPFSCGLSLGPLLTVLPLALTHLFRTFSDYVRYVAVSKMEAAGGTGCTLFCYCCCCVPHVQAPSLPTVSMGHEVPECSQHALWH